MNDVRVLFWGAESDTSDCGHASAGCPPDELCRYGCQPPRACGVLSASSESARRRRGYASCIDIARCGHVQLLNERKELVGCESMWQCLEGLHGFLPRGDDADQCLQRFLLVHISQAVPVAQPPPAGWQPNGPLHQAGQQRLVSLPLWAEPNAPLNPHRRIPAQAAAGAACICEVVGGVANAQLAKSVTE